MSFEEKQTVINMEAGADLSTKQYTFVVMASDGQVDPVASSGAAADGVLQNKPSAAGRAASVCIGGVTKIVASGVVTRGDEISSTNAGKAQTASSGHQILGRALETAASDGQLIAMLYEPRGAKA